MSENIFSTADGSKLAFEFELLVRRYFQFLVDEYGYVAHSVRFNDQGDQRDHSISLKYTSEAMKFLIGVSPLGSSVNAFFKNPRWYDDKAPERIKSVSLDDVVRWKSGGTVKPLLQEMCGARRKTWPDGFIPANFETVIQKLAERVRAYAIQIVRGDASDFREIAT